MSNVFSTLTPFICLKFLNAVNFSNVGDTILVDDPDICGRSAADQQSEQHTKETQSTSSTECLLPSEDYTNNC